MHEHLMGPENAVKYPSPRPNHSKKQETTPLSITFDRKSEIPMPYLEGPRKSRVTPSPAQPDSRFSELISVDLIVPISPEATARIRIVHHDERPAISILVKVTEQTHEIGNAHPRTSLVDSPSRSNSSYLLLHARTIVLHDPIDLLLLALLQRNQTGVYRVLHTQA
jgi:hypothetical protein